MLFTDKVQVVNRENDVVFNAPSDDTETIVKAYIENNSKIRYGSDGAPYTPSFLVFLPSDTEVYLDDYIRIIQIHGVDPRGDEEGLKEIKQIKRVGGFSVSHLEVYV